MSGVMSTTFLEEALSQEVNQGVVTPANKWLRLYTNPHLPVSTDNVGMYNEATDAMYVPVELLGPAWTIGAFLGIVTAHHDYVSFFFGAAANLYGWFMTDATGTIFYGAEQFTPGLILIPSFGGSLGVSVDLVLQSPC